MKAEEARRQLAKSVVPLHLAVIPDGNRRWAEDRGTSATAGHRKGFEVAKRLSRFCREIGIHTVTVWAFSTENWKRSPNQVGTLMELYEEWIEDLLPEAVEEEVRVVHLGRKAGVPRQAAVDAATSGFPEGLPPSLVVAIEDIERKTATFERNVINLGINYGGADEVERAVDRMVREAQRLGVGVSSLDVRNFLDTAGQPHPEPDIVLRTSGEYRISGFLPLQSAYAELAFTQKYFPDLTEEDIVEVVKEYSRRVRRFGG